MVSCVVDACVTKLARWAADVESQSLIHLSLTISSTFLRYFLLLIARPPRSLTNSRHHCSRRMLSRLPLPSFATVNRSARIPLPAFAPTSVNRLQLTPNLCSPTASVLMSSTSQASPSSPASLQPNGTQLNGSGHAHSESIPSGPSHARSASSFHIASRLSAFTAPTVWHEFTPLAAATKAMNLGQGFPGFSPPQFVKDAAARAVSEQGYDFLISQYARSAGHLPLTQRLAEQYRVSLNRAAEGINPLTEVLVTVGASEALCALMLGILNEGDEVVMLEPAFDIYIAQAEMCGARIRYVPMRTRPVKGSEAEEEWYVDMDELAGAFSNKTRLFLLNTPHNPTGKVFSRSELSAMCAVLHRFPAVVTLSDEVYEHMVYAPNEHISIASLPGMWDRTVTVSSAGKTFSVTGWKIGWVIGAEHIVKCGAIAHQWLSFSTCTPLQAAVAVMHDEAVKPFEGHSSYYDYLTATYLRRRALLADRLTAVGLRPILPQGGFFIVADTSRVRIPKEYDDGSVTRDWAFCRWLTKEVGVSAIPPSAFMGEETRGLAKNWVRFAFCKTDEVHGRGGEETAQSQGVHLVD